MVEATVGSPGVASVLMRDAQGAETKTYDVTGGIQWTSTHPDVVAVFDDDEDPRDARIEFLQVFSDEDVFLEVSFDGDPGDGQRAVTARSEAIRVVPGPAATAEVVVRFEEVV